MTHYNYFITIINMPFVPSKTLPFCANSFHVTIVYLYNHSSSGENRENTSMNSVKGKSHCSPTVLTLRISLCRWTELISMHDFPACMILTNLTSSGSFHTTL